MYLASNSQPDIACAVHQCARFTHAPWATHGDAVIHICRYLKGTSTSDLILQLTKELQLDTHVDSDYAGLWRREHNQNPVCIKSCTSFVISLAKCPLLWQSKLQGQLALSTMEAEYIALSTSMRSLIPLKTLVGKVAKSLMKDLTFLTNTYSSVLKDNNGALILATVPRRTPHSKHIAVPYHFFCKHVAKSTIKIFKVASDQNKAEIFTNGLDHVKFQSRQTLLMGWWHYSCQLSLAIVSLRGRVTYHTYSCGCDDKHTIVLLTVPTATDSWEPYLVQHYWISTKISNSATQLTSPLLYKTTLLSLAVKPSPIIPDPLYVILQSNPFWMHSLCVIILCFYLFQSPTSVVIRLGLFPLSYFITHLLYKQIFPTVLVAMENWNC